jgi:surfactin family lipopeptide synthetase A
MNTVSFVTNLLQKGTELWTESGKVHCRAPEGVLTPSSRGELSKHKGEILALLGEHRKFVLASFSQQGLWFLEQLVSDNPFYNMPVYFRLRGSLDVAALERTLREIVRRHEILRTAFVALDGQPFQVIAAAQILTLEVIDLRELPGSEQEAELRRLAAEEAKRTFDLTRWPLLRAKLLCLGEKEHVLLLTMHHIISDGWSLGILFRELAALYEAFSSNEPSPLTELPVQYADYAIWQRRWLEGDVLEAQLAYWKDHLASIPLLEVPTDRPRPAMQTFQGDMEHFEIDSDLTENLKTLSQRSGTSFFMTLLAAFVTLLARYSGQEDIVVGSVIANRNRAELERLIGFFVNTLVLRTDLSGRPTFRELLDRVRQEALKAYAHQDLPFEKLVEEIQPERDMSRNPLFQVMFVLQDAPRQDVELPGLVFGSAEEVHTGTAKFDLTLIVKDTGHGLIGSLEYNTDLFDRATIDRMAGHYQMLLEGIIADPDRPIWGLPLFSPRERHQMLVEWNDTGADYPQNTCFHHLFEDQVERMPDVIGVVYEGQQLTYRALNARANQLAHHLRSLGVGPEVPVGICMERSLEMIVGLLGVLKAGGAFLPLDPAYPKRRLAFMLSDSQVPVLLTQEKLLAGLPEHGARVVCLDTDWNTIHKESEENPLSGVMADNLAYMIYTSGSTGTPKGVLVAHGGLCNVSEAHIRMFKLGSTDRVLQFFSFSFDASIFDIVLALRVGATLCLGRQESLLPGPALMRLLQNLSITFVVLTPSVLGALPTEKLPALEILNVAGEACPADLVPRWIKGRRIFNLYGPTEDTIWSTVAECRADGRTPPIGRPINNTNVFLMDAHLHPVPIGVPAELHIGGVGLARGYLRRPELTAEKFIPDPYSEQPGTRLYKTGDLTRYLPDGNIEFLGRIDHQVKVRGFRIELGEIESALSSHEVIRECVVVADDNEQGDKKLVAYVVCDELVSSLSLRRFLREILPDYMIPSQFIPLDAIPLTPNGKVDFQLLRSLSQGHEIEKLDYVAPCSTMEKQIAEIWRGVLGVDKVGLHDNFFDLGGHSLLVIRAISLIEENLHIEVPFAEFVNQTLGQISANCERQVRKK